MSVNIKIAEFLTRKNISLIHNETVGSTMKDIKKYIGSNNICMIADEQTSGIGRRGNKWISPKGNIYLSFLFEFNLSIQNHFLFTAVTANSICKFLNYYINENIHIKWPNDIKINESKIAGIMTEIIEHNNKKYVIIGMGINISNSPKINDYKTCCLKEFNPKIKNEAVLLNMIEAFFLEYEMILKKEYNIIIDKFKNNMQYLGETINILLPNGKNQNVFLKNLNFDGSILIEKDGKQANIFSARIINDIN
ncbi:MAG: biotin--[acetyl-CoA-carboxylase] ligase [Alphaproteobacteria bacterium]